MTPRPPCQATLMDGVQFTVQPGESVLHAAHQADIALPHSCSDGRCGTCRIRVLEGDVSCDDALGLLGLEESKQGWALACTTQLRSDVRLDAGDWRAMADFPARTLPCRIDAIERLKPDVLHVSLRLPPHQALRWMAGQHLTVSGPGGVSRAYSIANVCPGGGSASRVELHIKRVNSGVMSTYWFEQAKPHDLLRIKGPLGGFHLPDVAGRDVLMLATGVGWAPVGAMLGALAERGQDLQPRNCRVLWGVRHPDDFYIDAHAIAKACNARMTRIVSSADATWDGERGHVQDVFLANEGGDVDWNRTLVFACGSPAMVSGARRAFAARGLAPQHFYADAFVAS